MTILYINYTDCGKMGAGSTVRPMKMLEAFRQTGHRILELTGEQTCSDRVQKVKKMSKLIDLTRPDICYIESPVHPIYWRCDRQLIRKLHRMGVPTGYFCRDFYLKFRKDFPRRSDSLINYAKDVIWELLQKKTDKVLRCCDIVYLPSDECKELFEYRDMRSLPPAGEDKIITRQVPNYTCIYVGGIIGHYNCDLLLETFEYLYQKNHSYHLILVTRKEKWNSYFHPLKNAKWLEVYHTSGEGLTPLYKRASLGLIVLKTGITYNNYGIPVKIFEYISYGLPVVAVNCKAIAKMINSDRIGLVAESSVEDIAIKIEELLNNPNEYNSNCKIIRNTLQKKHLWKHRVNQVITDLTQKKSGSNS